MTKQEVQQVASLSSGTIGKALGTNIYKDIDQFIGWLFRPLTKDTIWGELASFSDNLTIALSNAVELYKKHFIGKYK